MDFTAAYLGFTAVHGRCVFLQGEIANRRATQNNFVRQLGDISRTLKSMGLYHQIQVRSGLILQPCSTCTSMLTSVLSKPAC